MVKKEFSQHKNQHHNNDASEKTVAARDFPAPQNPTEEDIEIICKAHGFDATRREELTKILNELVYIQQVAKERELASQRDQAESTKSLLGDIQKIRKKLQKNNLATKKAINITLASRVAPFFSPFELSRRFHNFVLPSVDPSPFALEEEDELCFRENSLHTLESRLRGMQVNFFREKGTEVLDVMFDQMEISLKYSLVSYKQSLSSRGGRKPMRLRRNMVLNLLNIYEALGGKISKTNIGQHVDFCSQAFDAMGLPDKGLKDEIPRAYEELRKKQNHLKKT